MAKEAGDEEVKGSRVVTPECDPLAKVPAEEQEGEGAGISHEKILASAKLSLSLPTRLK